MLLLKRVKLKSLVKITLFHCWGPKVWVFLGPAFVVLIAIVGKVIQELLAKFHTHPGLVDKSPTFDATFGIVISVALVTVIVIVFLTMVFGRYQIELFEDGRLDSSFSFIFKFKKISIPVQSLSKLLVCKDGQIESSLRRMYKIDVFALIARTKNGEEYYLVRKHGSEETLTMVQHDLIEKLKKFVSLDQ